MPLKDGQNCPICNVKMFSDDPDIAFCPICGEAHHRDCYLKNGRCAFAAEHGKAKPEQAENEPENKEGDPHGDSGQRPKYARGDVERDRVGGACPRCGRMCTSDTLFCPYCGLDLNKYNGPDPNGGMPNGPGMGGFGGPGSGFPFGGSNMGGANMGGASGGRPFYNNPLGGVDPHETVDDIPVLDTASFVGPNAARYVPRFVALQKKQRKTSLNWAGFFLPGIWFFYRKMYMLGTFFSLLQIAVMLMSVPLMAIFVLPDDIGQLSNSQLFEVFSQNALKIPPAAFWVSVGGLVLQLALSIVVLLMADRLYMKHTVRAISAIKADEEDDDPHRTMIRRGGVNALAAGLGLFLTMQLYSIFAAFVF